MLELFDYRLIELRTLGTISEEIDKALIKEVNLETGKPYGYSMHRFPASLVKTYEWLCEHGYSKYQEAVARRVRVIGLTAFDPLGYKKQGLVKDAEDTLNFIQKKGDVQILITKGELLVQESKVVHTNLDRWFGDDIRIVDAKDEATFRECKTRFSDCSVFSVGNSYNSDIVPALKAGVRGIFIPYYTWLGEQPPAETEIDTVRVFRIDQVKDIVDLYEQGAI